MTFFLINFVWINSKNLFSTSAVYICKHSTFLSSDCYTEITYLHGHGQELKAPDHVSV